MAINTKRSATLLATRKMQVTMKYHYIPIRMAKIKKGDNTKRWQRCGEARSLMQSL